MVETVVAYGPRWIEGVWGFYTLWSDGTLWDELGTHIRDLDRVEFDLELTKFQMELEQYGKQIEIAS